MALAGVVGAIGGNTDDLVIGRELTEQFGQHRGITHVAAGDLDRLGLQRFLVDPEMDLAPGAALRVAMLARIPLAFTLDLDACAVDQPVQRPRDTRCGNFTARVFWRRLSLLKSGTS